jgi:NADPH:quinone reductase-like Zn-dependent oxidoreductase
MRAYEVHDASGPSGWKLVERPEPKPGPGEVAVRMRAASLNFRDLLVSRGQYAGKPKDRVIPLSDGAGEVISVGEGVTRFSPGDHVAANFFQGWEEGTITADVMRTDLGGKIDGVLAEVAVFSERGLVRIPDSLSFEEAATLPCAGVTAWHGITTAGIEFGDTILLIGTGGVSIFGLQLAKHFGAKTILLSSSDDKLAKARSLGADQTINYRQTPDWEKHVWEMTDRRGVDLVLEVGGAGTLEKSLACTRYGGQVSLIGVLTGVAGVVNPVSILFKSMIVRGIYVGSRQMLEQLVQACVTSNIHPVIDRVFPFEMAREALEHLASAEHVGKVVVKIS